MTLGNNEPNKFTFTDDNILITYQPIHFIDRPDLPLLLIRVRIQHSLFIEMRSVLKRVRLAHWFL